MTYTYFIKFKWPGKFPYIIVVRPLYKVQTINFCHGDFKFHFAWQNGQTLKYSLFVAPKQNGSSS